MFNIVDIELLKHGKQERWYQHVALPSFLQPTPPPPHDNHALFDMPQLMQSTFQSQLSTVSSSIATIMNQIEGIERRQIEMEKQMSLSGDSLPSSPCSSSYTPKRKRANQLCRFVIIMLQPNLCRNLVSLSANPFWSQLICFYIANTKPIF